MCRATHVSDVHTHVQTTTNIQSDLGARSYPHLSHHQAFSGGGLLATSTIFACAVSQFTVLCEPACLQCLLAGVVVGVVLLPDTLLPGERLAAHTGLGQQLNAAGATPRSRHTLLEHPAQLSILKLDGVEALLLTAQLCRRVCVVVAGLHLQHGLQRHNGVHAIGVVDVTTAGCEDLLNHQGIQNVTCSSSSSSVQSSVHRVRLFAPCRVRDRSMPE